MFAKHNITITTTSPYGAVGWEVVDSYGTSEDAALRSYLAFQNSHYVHGGSLQNTAALLSATYRNDGSFRTHNRKNESRLCKARKANWAEQERRQNAYYDALRKDNPGW